MDLLLDSLKADVKDLTKCISHVQGRMDKHLQVPKNKDAYNRAKGARTAFRIVRNAFTERHDTILKDNPYWIKHRGRKLIDQSHGVK